MSCPVVLIVWFDSDGYPPQWEPPDDESLVYCGLPMWRQKGKPVMSWAIDGLISASDVCMLMFGPFANKDEARQAMSAIESTGKPIQGFRILNEHCVKHHYKLTSHMWTDG